MILNTIPARVIDGAELTHGGRLLTVVVARTGKPRKDGTAKVSPHTTTYAVERTDGTVRLVREDGMTYTLTRYNCDCPDAVFTGRSCKHMVACRVTGLIADTNTAGENP